MVKALDRHGFRFVIRQLYSLEYCGSVLRYRVGRFTVKQLESNLMQNLSPSELEVAQLIVETLNLEDVSAEEIERDAPLFRDGLGLDSIDALELSLGIKQRYGIQLRADDENITAIFSTLASLTQYIQDNR